MTFLLGSSVCEWMSWRKLVLVTRSAKQKRKVIRRTKMADRRKKRAAFMKAVTDLHQSLNELVYGDPAATSKEKDVWAAIRVLEARAMAAADAEPVDDPLENLSTLFHTEPEPTAEPSTPDTGDSLAETDAATTVSPGGRRSSSDIIISGDATIRLVGGTAIQLTGDAAIQITGGTIRLQQMSPEMLREMADEADRRVQRDRDRFEHY